MTAGVTQKLASGIPVKDLQNAFMPCNVSLYGMNNPHLEAACRTDLGVSPDVRGGGCRLQVSGIRSVESVDGAGSESAQHPV